MGVDKLHLVAHKYKEGLLETKLLIHILVHVCSYISRKQIQTEYNEDYIKIEIGTSYHNKICISNIVSSFKLFVFAN